MGKGTRRPFKPTERERALARLFKERRKAKGFTLIEMAKKLSVVPLSLVRYEKQERAFPYALLLRAEEYLGPLVPQATRLPGASDLAEGRGIEDKLLTVGEPTAAYGRAARGAASDDASALTREEDEMLAVYRRLAPRVREILVVMGRAALLLDEKQ